MVQAMAIDRSGFPKVSLEAKGGELRMEMNWLRFDKPPPQPDLVDLPTELLQPIEWNSPPAVEYFAGDEPPRSDELAAFEAAWESECNRVYREMDRKLAILFSVYGIDPAGNDSYKRLAMRLAAQFVSGFSISTSKSGRRATPKEKNIALVCHVKSRLKQAEKRGQSIPVSYAIEALIKEASTDKHSQFHCGSGKDRNKLKKTLANRYSITVKKPDIVRRAEALASRLYPE